MSHVPLIVNRVSSFAILIVILVWDQGIHNVPDVRKDHITFKENVPEKDVPRDTLQTCTSQNVILVPKDAKRVLLLILVKSVNQDGP